MIWPIKNCAKNLHRTLAQEKRTGGFTNVEPVKKEQRRTFANKWLLQKNTMRWCSYSRYKLGSKPAHSAPNRKIKNLYAEELDKNRGINLEWWCRKTRISAQETIKYGNIKWCASWSTILLLYKGEAINYTKMQHGCSVGVIWTTTCTGLWWVEWCHSITDS